MLSSWILMSLAALTAAATPSGDAAWEADYGQALEQTREDNRPLLVVLDDPTDESRRLDESLLDPTSGALPLGGYDLCRVDVSTEYGKRVAEVFRATSFPHVAIIDKTGSVILTRMSGPITETSWKATLARYESGVRRGTQSYTVSKPVVSEASVSTPASTTISAPAYTIPTQPAKPYCAACQRR